jgi:sulfur carrier protein ThiS
MNIQESGALVEIKNQLCELQELLAKSRLQQQEIMALYEKTVALRSNATVLRNYASGLLANQV